MRYECPRCHQPVFSTGPEHLCADLAKRYERQKAAVELVREILGRYRVRIRFPAVQEQIALDIVKALSGRDLGT